MHIIERADKKYLDQIVEIFYKELYISPITFLGKQFIKDMFISILKDEYGYVCLSKNEHKVLGFIFIIKKNLPLFRCISLRSIFLFITVILTDYVKLKAFLISFLRLFLLRANLKNDNISTIELSHFAITQEHKKKGIGKELIKAIEKYAKINKYSTIFTSTHNLKLVEFYKKSKNAKLLSKIDIGIYESYNIIWSIK